MIPLNVSGVIGNGICDPKIDQFKLPADKNEICRFEVRVHDLLFMDHVHRLKHLVAILNKSTPCNDKGIKTQNYLLPIVGNPDHIECLFLLFLKKPCKVFTRQRLTFSRKPHNVSYAMRD
jgi:hypothetical protein